MSSAAQVGAGPPGGSPLTVHHLPPAAPRVLFPPITSCQHTLTSGPPITSCSHLSSPFSTQHLLPYPSPSRPPTISCAYPLSPVPHHHLSLPIPPPAHPLSPVLIHCLCLHMSPLASTPLFLPPPPILSSVPPLLPPPIYSFLLLSNASSHLLPPLPTPSPAHPLSAPVTTSSLLPLPDPCYLEKSLNWPSWPQLKVRRTPESVPSIFHLGPFESLLTAHPASFLASSISILQPERSKRIHKSGLVIASLY